MYAHQNRNQLRQMYFEAWRKRRENLPLEPMEALVADVIEEHPEYHALLEKPESSLEKDFPPEYGQTNPFLHMGMHIAIREQLATDRPAGFAEAYRALVTRTGDPHEAEHRILTCLAESLWNAQRTGQAPDETAYLEKVKSLSER